MQIVVNGAAEAPPDSKPLPSQGSYYPNALTCLGCDALNPPLAELLSRYYQLQGQWLIASPIHWEATHNDAMIVAVDEMLELDDKESRRWFAVITEFLNTSGIETFYHDAYTWLLKIDDQPAINSKSVYKILHQSLMPTLAALDKELFWQRFITELQMFLSSHPLNNQRQSKLTINGLWLWGEGEFKPTRKEPLFTDDEILLKSVKQAQPVPSSLIFPKNSLLLIKYPHHIDIASLREKTQKKSVQWYWNNLAYSQPSIKWWVRLWRS
ncbi:hypothetical protein [Legionella clemsonensis]|uniref:Cofactor-independent phosphoglycerate mutase n=1 Tax=Legionella clemsonensis TaxID=1867846 RepID=A0A222P239_9GAMM|nr:hypothetical protein [Legionella clemsonensis]ASQ45899.1 hypothetical protein clem_06720 [Legionella clemsonensis]